MAHRHVSTRSRRSRVLSGEGLSGEGLSGEALSGKALSGKGVAGYGPGRTGMVEVTVTVPRDRTGILRRYARRLATSRPAQREEVLWQLRHHAPAIRRMFGVCRMAVFGSTVRDESRRQSDVDILVDFVSGRPTGMFEFVALKNWLEGLLSRPVDLITPANIKPRLRQRILQEAVDVL